MLKRALQGIYSILPFKNQLFKVLRLFHPGENITRHLKFKGKIKVQVDEKNSFYIQNNGDGIEQILFWHGIEGWEKYSTRGWKALAKNSGTIVDVGANTGVFSLIAASVNPAAKIFCFEPVPFIYDMLQNNIQLNAFSNITPLCKAASDKSGMAKIQTLDSGNLYESSLDSGHMEHMTHLKKDLKVIFKEIETVRLDDFITNNNIRAIDLMKIDVESHEPAVIEGMGALLEKFQPILFIEILTGEVAEKLSRFFSPEKYIFFNISEEAGYQKVGTLSRSDSFNFLICPVSRQHQLPEFIFNGAIN